MMMFKGLVLLGICAVLSADAVAIPRNRKYKQWASFIEKMWYPDYDFGSPGGFPGGDPGMGGGGWNPAPSTTPAPIACSDVGGMCLYENNCHAEKGTRYTCADGLVCCLPPVLGDNDCGVSGTSRIVHGNEAEAHRWPWQASLQTPSGFHFCGGSLIHKQWVVTAAHCLDGSELKVVLGEHDRSIASENEQIVGVAKQILHEDYSDGAPYPNDIALLKLETPVEFTNEVKHVCVPTSGESFTAEHTCWISGWGDTKDTGDETKLHELKKTITDNPTCASKWGENMILETHICIGNGDKGACNGDSGGPLSCEKDRWYLAGATSWGYNGCQTEGYPNVYTRVSEYRDWILHTIRMNQNLET